jgi:hypothetical protein
MLVALAFSVIWAAQWIAGPLLTWPRRLVLLAALAVAMIYGDVAVFPIFGFPSQMLGLTFLVVLVAVLVRAPASFRQTAVLAAALLVGIGFTYHLYLPAAGMSIMLWLWRRRPDVVRHVRLVIPLAVVAGVLASVVSVIGVVYAHHDDKLGDAGGVVSVARALLLTLGLIVAAAMLSPAGRRLRTWRAYAMTVIAVAALPAALLVHQAVTDVAGVYYLEKSLHSLLVTLLAGTGAVVLFLPRPGRKERVPAIFLAGAILVAGGLVVDDRPYEPAKPERLARQWHSGSPGRNNVIAGIVLTVADRVPAQSGTTTVVVTDSAYGTLMCSLYLAMIQRTSGRVQPFFTQFLPEDPQGLAVNLGQSIDRLRTPVLIVATTPATRDIANQVRAARPDLPIQATYVAK